MEITKCLTISTAHVAKETMKELMCDSHTNNFDLIVYEKGKYGVWIYIHEEIETELNALPEDLFRCISLAIENDCKWLCLDCDGEKLDSFTVYDW